MVSLPDPAKSRAVLIGVSHYYDEDLPDRPAIARNLTALRDQFTDPAVWGLADEHCQVVTNPDRRSLVSAIRAAADQATDTLLVYYGGHGELDHGERERSLYLSLTDSASGEFWDWFNYQDFRKLLRRARDRVRDLIVILDCCHSGQALHYGPLGNDTAEFEAAVDNGDQTALLTACAATQRAWVAENAKYSVFTGALIELLSQGSQQESEFLSVNAVHRTLKTRLARQPGSTPQLLPVSNGGEIVLARNRHFASPGVREEAPAEAVAHVAIHEIVNINPVPPPSLPATVDALRPLPSGVLGRDCSELVELADEQAKLGRPFIALVHGPGGVGSSTMARLAASRLGNAWPNRLEVDLRGFDANRGPKTPADLCEELLRQTGHQQIPTDIAAGVAAWHRWLSNQPALVILDNARDAAQISELVPNNGKHCILITSRVRIDFPQVGYTLELSKLNRDESVKLLCHHAQLKDATEDLVDIASWCDGLPYVLAAVGDQLRRTDVGWVATAMRDSEYPLAELPRVNAAVAASFTASVKALSADTRNTLWNCGNHPGPDFDAVSIAAMTRSDELATELRLAELADAGILRQDLNRYRFHHLYGWHAKRMVGDHESDLMARERLSEHLYHRAVSAGAQLWGSYDPDRSAIVSGLFDSPARAMRWLAAAGKELRAGAEAAIAGQHPHYVQFSDTVAQYLLLANQDEAASALLWELLTTCEQRDDKQGIVSALNRLGEVAILKDDCPTAKARHERALQIARRAEDNAGSAAAYIGLGDVDYMNDDYANARLDYQQAMATLEGAEGIRTFVTAQYSLATASLMDHHRDVAAENFRGALDLGTRSKDLIHQVVIHCGLADLHRADHPRADHHLARAMRLADMVGLQYCQAGVWARKAGLHLAREEFAEARAAYRTAARLYAESGSSGEADRYRTEADKLMERD